MYLENKYIIIIRSKKVKIVWLIKKKGTSCGIYILCYNDTHIMYQLFKKNLFCFYYKKRIIYLLKKIHYTGWLTNLALSPLFFMSFANLIMFNFKLCGLSLLTWKWSRYTWTWNAFKYLPMNELA